MSERQQRAKHIQTHASKKLRINLRILSAVFIILLVITLYELFVLHVLFSQVLIALTIGFTAGFISSRMYKISWDKNTAEVVGRIDVYGIVVLILFILFELNRNWIANLFSGGEALGSISLVLITTALLGRIIGTSRKILQVLSSERII